MRHGNLALTLADFLQKTDRKNLTTIEPLMLTKQLLNVSNVLYLVGYGVRDVLLLRLLSITAMLVALPYYAYHVQNYKVPIGWNLAFMVINLVWVVKIFLERRPPRFTPDERRLYEYTFCQSCTPREMLQLLAKATWSTAKEGETLVAQGATPGRLLIIHRGEAEVRNKGQQLATLRDGDLVGEVSYLTQEPAVADVVANGQLEYVWWNQETLQQLFDQRIELKVAIQNIIGHNLVDRLTSSLASVPEVSIHASLSE